MGISPCSVIQDMRKNHRTVVYNISLDFKISEVLGEGAYGTVCLAIHTPSGTKVAIKRLEPFSRALLCVRALREIKTLRILRGHENIVTMFDIQRPADFGLFHEVYLIEEYMQSDLSKVIRTQNLSYDHIQYFTYQILRGIKYVHSAGIIHRDLKPANLLVNSNCDLKICDFGLSTNTRDGHDDPSKSSPLTEYVATRWYRAPEIMFSASRYSTAVDMWSVGCIVAEMYVRSPLFPGSDYRSQITSIFSKLGTPAEMDQMTMMSRRARKYIHTLPRSTYTLDSFLARSSKNIDYSSLDLIQKLLVYAPNKRMTVHRALEHDFVQRYHDANDEPEAKPVDLGLDKHQVDYETAEVAVLKRKLFDEIKQGR